MMSEALASASQSPRPSAAIDEKSLSAPDDIHPLQAPIFGRRFSHLEAALCTRFTLARDLGGHAFEFRDVRHAASFLKGPEIVSPRLLAKSPK
jgi:hypothetical protein